MSLRVAKEHLSMAVSAAADLQISSIEDIRTKAAMKEELYNMAREAWVVIGCMNDACDEIGVPHFGGTK